MCGLRTFDFMEQGNAKVERGLVVSPDNPFRKEIQTWQSKIKGASRTTTGESYKQTRVTIIEETEYFPGKFTKLFHNRELLYNLGPYECKVLIYIALNLNYESEQIHIPWRDVGLDRRILSRALLELMVRRILVKVEGKKAWYWVNVTLLIMGNINKHSTKETI